MQVAVKGQHVGWVTGNSMARKAEGRGRLAEGVFWKVRWILLTGL